SFDHHPHLDPFPTRRSSDLPILFSDPEAIAEHIIRDVGTELVVGLPLGLGKANHIVNALYARAVADRSVNLTLFSALTLEKPKPDRKSTRLNSSHVKISYAV